MDSFSLNNSIVTQGCLTLCGLKPSSVFNVEVKNPLLFMRNLKMIRKPLLESGIEIFPFSKGNGKMIIFLYRKNHLFETLRKKDVSEYLTHIGYPKNPEDCLKELKKRLLTSSQYPHEIGLFLGFDCSDCRRYMEDNGKGCIFSGYWKVYSEAEKKIELFKTYDRCRNCYRKYLNMNMDIRRITVKTDLTEALS